MHTVVYFNTLSVVECILKTAKELSYAAFRLIGTYIYPILMSDLKILARKGYHNLSI